tara:strand:- start:344 stop:721 length:378 start_codon:yes stop_codon:yes gene_type:complete
MSYIQDPNNPNKQIPNNNYSTNVLNKVSNATAPPSASIQKRCSYVLINQTGSYSFAYDSSITGTDVTNSDSDYYITASVFAESSEASARLHSPYRLDINPVAWKGNLSTEPGIEGDVTFVYVRVS